MPQIYNYRALAWERDFYGMYSQNREYFMRWSVVHLLSKKPLKSPEIKSQTSRLREISVCRYSEDQIGRKPKKYLTLNKEISNWYTNSFSFIGYTFFAYLFVHKKQKLLYFLNFSFVEFSEYSDCVAQYISSGGYQSNYMVVLFVPVVLYRYHRFSLQWILRFWHIGRK